MSTPPAAASPAPPSATATATDAGSVPGTPKDGASATPTPATPTSTAGATSTSTVTASGITSGIGGVPRVTSQVNEINEDEDADAPPPAPKGRTCEMEDCQVTMGLKQCHECGRVYYCSREHQLAHWGAHRPDCKKGVGIEVPHLYSTWHSRLTLDQLNRIQAMKQLYRDQDMFTLSNSIRCFEGEIDPEAELQKWEALANAYKMECERRGKVAKLTKKKIWLALVAACTVGPDIAKIKAICVSAKKLKQLERLLETYAACGCGVDLKRWPNPNPTSQMKKRRRGKGKGKGKGKRR
eukprot:TRINITY_DN387_c0_g1_i1.p1 TRINITY_DN387_c0_g1~~TRINITY_DN387_c0_g1_i1.p1  ORF type:complete len:296 (+),score=48.07 TRINITY_DN387_c0_g1_i1:242-1129(+)